MVAGNSTERRIEPALGRVLLATAGVRAPLVWCICLALGLQSLILIIPSWRGEWWVVPGIGVCAILWSFGATFAVSNLLNGGLSPSYFLAGIGVRRFGGTRSSVIKLALIPAILCGIPGWIGVTGSGGLILGALLYVKKGKAGLAALAKLLIGLGVCLAVVGALLPAFVSPLVGVFAVGCLAVLVIVAMQSMAGLLRALWVECGAALLVLICVVILAIVGGSPRLAGIIVLVGGIILPGLDLVSVQLARRIAIGQVKDLTANMTMRAALESKEHLRRCEDVIRESDEFFRVCQPVYSHLRPSSVGEAGYISWPEHDGVAYPLAKGQWCVARGISSAINPVLQSRDIVGTNIRRVVEGLLTNLSEIVDDEKLSNFVGRVFRPWQTRIYPGAKDQREYLKMPWESGEVLAIPKEFSCNFFYPVGCGVLDSSALPCEVRSLQVNIQLHPDVVADFDDAKEPAGGPNRNARDLAKQLVWRCAVIIPGVYEALLNLLTIEMRGQDALGVVNQDALVKALNAKVFESLPATVSSLVSVRVISIDVAQIAISEFDRNVSMQLIIFKQTLPGKKIEVVRHLLSLVREFQRRTSDTLYKKNQVLAAFVAINTALNNGLTEIDAALAGGMKNEDGHVNNDAEMSRTIIGTAKLGLTQELNTQKDILVKALNDIETAFASPAK